MTEDKEMLGHDRKCPRCEDWTRNFIPAFQLCCRSCLSKQELYNYIVSPLTKAMKGLDGAEKKKVLLHMIKDFKEKRTNLGAAPCT